MWVARWLGRGCGVELLVYLVCIEASMGGWFPLEKEKEKRVGIKNSSTA